MAAKYKVAVIGRTGKGNYGHGLDTAWLGMDNVEIVAVADVDDKHIEDTVARIKKEKGNTPQGARDYRGMLDRKDVDAVIIATPDHWHALPMIAAVEAGADVWVQKPISVDIDEGKAMVAAARRTRKVVHVGTQRRSTPHLIDARDRVIRQRDAEQRAHSATKGQLTRARKRAANGVCPCCHRSFENVARHVAKQHPDFKP